MTGRHNFLERGWGPLEPFDDVLPTQLRKAQPKVFSHLITDHYHYFYLGGEGHNNSFDSWQFERGQEGDMWISRVDLPARVTTARFELAMNIAREDPERRRQWRHSGGRGDHRSHPLHRNSRPDRFPHPYDVLLGPGVGHQPAAPAASRALIPLSKTAA